MSSETNFTLDDTGDHLKNDPERGDHLPTMPDPTNDRERGQKLPAEPDHPSRKPPSVHDPQPFDEEDDEDVDSEQIA